MKITMRLIVSLVIVVALVTLAFSLYQVNRERDRLARDLERRSLILAESLQESLGPLIKSNSAPRMKRIVNRFGNRERLRGIMVLDRQGSMITATSNLNLDTKAASAQAVEAVLEGRSVGNFLTMEGQKAYVFTAPVTAEDDEVVGAVVMLYDASYIDVRLGEMWKQNLFRFVILSILVVFATVLVVRWSITGPIARLAEWMKDVRTAKPDTPGRKVPLRGDILSPLVSEVTELAKSLAIARKRAEEEARLRLKSESLWTPEGLKEYMRTALKGKKLFVVSNREPYMDVKEGRSIKSIIPAGGVVTALDPVMRICDGVWVAHGGGDADRETADDDGKIRVPPEEPAYTLKRVWLTKEEEDGYYYGFSNEGLWPLCHITHTRPEFRQRDWICYQKVNHIFAEALLAEIESEEAPLVLVQDYHFALLPLLIKKERPDAKVALFWHIPWSNPESFGICPWRQEILMGMLGADLIGFHIQFFCNNFLDTVDRFLESQIDWEEFSVRRGEHRALIKAFPISVGFDEGSPGHRDPRDKAALRETILKEIGIQATYIGVGVDRIDYTKGIPERFRAIERFLEKHEEFVEGFTFIELGAPSRDHIKKYREVMMETEEIVEKVNWRFQTKKWKPIVYLKAHHSHEEIRRYYETADLCMVTSLHDGMNLVAKEFVATKSDYDGVLILSQFAGASRELKDAIIVNPYDIEEMADAIKSALTLDPSERRERMKRMHAIVTERNIYRWAGKLIGELTQVRLPAES
ncbi:MAG: Trehalose-phosphate synthase [Syntrophorhabdaceae bacterium PtaU1.Bin034]|nr:MAG: Trehalose-phosphate synthase [Syntrophorhabdaceae bacterium PtaU1.Bin034]